MLGKTLSNYRIESELGRGGMGIVYRAHDTDLDRTVAIKFLTSEFTGDKSARDRFLREARTAAAIQHESICSIYEIGETDDGDMYIVMPFYEGGTLEDVIAGGPVEPDRVRTVVAEIAGGLQAAHNKGIIHRDIKPGNILIDPHGRVKILDFGLAKFADRMDLTRTQQSVGTMPYMSPEQLLSRPVDARTDIWALGVLTYEMLTGERPFQGDYAQAVSYAIVNVDPEPPAVLDDNLPDEINQMVMRCLEKEPDDRYASAGELLEDIKTPSTEKPASVRKPPSKIASGINEIFSERDIVISPKKVVTLFTLLGVVLVAAFFIFNRIGGPGNLSERHLAILPFRLIGGTADTEAFSFGLLESLTTSLTQLQRGDESFWVVPTSEVEPEMSVSDANRLLGVNLVVTGSIQQEDDNIRVNLTLNDANTMRIISSDQFDDRGSGSFAIQDEAVRRVTKMLGMQPDGTTAVVAASSNRGANDAYLKARGYLRSQQSVQELDVAIGLLTAAISDDPEFAAAYAALGRAYWEKYRHTEDSRWVDEAFEYSQRALELDDKLAEVHITLATINQGLRDYEAAIADYERALEIDPLNSEAYRLQASSLRGVGRMEDARASLDRSIELAPDYWRGYYSLALHHFRERDFDATIRAAEQGLEQAPDVLRLLNIQAVALWSQGLVSEAMERFDRIRELNPDYTTAWGNTATALFYNQRYPEAADMYEKVVNRLRPNSYAYRGYLADAYYWSDGERDKSEATYREAIELARAQLEVSEMDPDVYSSMAGYFAHLGEADSALAYLDRALALYSEGAIPASDAFLVGELFVTLGRLDSAKVWLERGLSQNAGWMQLQHSPWLAEVRKDVDFMERIAVYRPG